MPHNIRKQCWENTQYFTRVCLEVLGIISSVHIVMGGIEDPIVMGGIEVPHKDTGDCHRVGRAAQNIIKFCKRNA